MERWFCLKLDGSLDSYGLNLSCMVAALCVSRNEFGTGFARTVPRLCDLFTRHGIYLATFIMSPDVLGTAISDHYFNTDPSQLWVYDHFGPPVEMKVATYFRDWFAMPDLERIAMLE